MNFSFEITTAVMAMILTGIVQVFKMFGLPVKYAPLFSIIIGIIMTLSITYFEVTTRVVFFGIALGLSASGLFSFSTKTTEVVAGFFRRK